MYLYSVYKKELTKQFTDFFDKIKDKRSDITYLQTDLGGEFFNNKLKQIFADNKMEHYTTSMNRGHAFLAEQKIRELKKKLTRLKSLDKTVWLKTVLPRVEKSMNKSIIRHLGFSPEILGKTPLNEKDKILKELYVGKKITNQKYRSSRWARKKDKNIKSKLKNFRIWDLVYISYGRIFKKHYRSALVKTTTGKTPLFYEDEVFEIIKKKKAPISNLNIYIVRNKETGVVFKGRFYGDELTKA